LKIADLSVTDQLIIKQKVEALEALTGALGMGFETKNKYKIKNSLGQVNI
jgi:Scramblase